MHPKRLATLVLARYRKLRRYKDSGHVRSLKGTRETSVEFTTSFRRQSHFTFRFHSPHPYPPLRHRVTRHTVGQDSTSPFFTRCSYDGTEKAERGESLEMYVAGATGISRGSAYTIGALLFETVGPSELRRMRKLRTLKGKVLDGVPCVGLQGTLPVAGRVTAFVGAKDRLLRELTHHGFKATQRRWGIKTR